MSALIDSLDKQPRKLSKRALKKQARVDAAAKFEYEMSREGIREHLRDLERDVLGLDFVIKDPGDRLARENTAAMFKRLLDLVDQVDITRASRDQQSVLHWYIYKGPKNRLEELRSMTLTSSFAATVLPNLSGSMREMYGKLNKLRLEEDPVQVVVEGAERPAAGGGAARFPVITHDSPAIKSAIERLRETWLRANTRQLSVSDRFTVDALATSYLPDSLRLLANLSRYSEESRVESEKIFLEQVALMQGQLDEIFKQEERAEMSEMRAHTLFLKNKNTGELLLG